MFWNVTLAIGGMLWVGSTLAIIATASGIDRPTPGTTEFVFRWGGMGAEWLLFGTTTVVAAVKVFRRA
jgi:hypothetical protein